MMAQALSEEELASHSEVLRERFLEHHADDEEMDSRDIEMVRSDPLYVPRFVAHNKGNLDNAYKHMVDCQKWRKSFGINDILWTDIDESLWKSGMAWNRGYDNDGNNVCILNIHIHRKDSKKAPMLLKWIAFSFEMHRKVYPKNKMCMVFDMNGAGLAQMDMDLVRFIVNAFKIYYPNLLSWLLVYNMPWVLQAAWKIVQGWLGEGAIAKVKFVTKETMCEYIPKDQLLVKFGGEDTWEFDYQVERDRMFELAMSTIMPEAGAEDEDEGEESLISETADRARQVRFSSGLPPTRQSRFGPDDGEERRPVSPDQRLLQGGSGRGFRRRQVSRLMSLQDGKRSNSMDEGAESASLNGRLSARRHSADPRNGGVATMGDVMLSPSTELTFIGKKDSEVTCTLTLTNISDNSVLYKIKTTAPTRYKVRPNVALVDGRSVAKVQVLFSPGAGKTSVSQDKFLVQTYTFSPEASLPDMERLIEFWRALPSKDIREHRMHCRWLSDIPPKPALKESSASSAAAKVTNLQSPQTTTPATPLRTLELKVATLCAENVEIKQKLDKLLILNYVLICLVLVVLLVAYFL